jgi:hypothetical protein
MGTYYAQNVVITDTLDKNLDWNTLKTGYSNYPYSAELSENGVLKFTFKNINLTWKAQSDLLSRGLVTYTVKQKPELPAMTKIYAKANVYFDFNPPVATNSVLNTIYRYPQTGIVSAKTNKAISIYPNPANSVLNVCAKDIHFRYLNIYDITGRLLIHNIPSGSNVYKLDISSLINGMYFIEATDVNGTIYNSKFLKN